VLKLTDEIFESLRGRFKQKRCPTALAGDRPYWKAYPNEMKKCDCSDVIYDGWSSCPHTFNWSDFIVAKVDTKCNNFKWSYRYKLDPTMTPDLKREVIGKISAKDLREQITRIGAREAEFLAYAPYDKKQFNCDHVTIQGFAFSRKFLRKVLMYQDSQIFELTLITVDEEEFFKNKYSDDGYRPELYLVSDKHYIVVAGQNTKITAEFELGAFPIHISV